MIFPGTTYLVTRRCTGRQFLLRPDTAGVVQKIFEYCLAYGAWRTGVLIHAYCVMSNHWHAVVTDPDGRLPEFMHDVNQLVGKCMNVHLGRWESLWSSEHYSAVRLEDRNAIIDKIIYVITNPVAAALVPTWSQWPGAKTGPRALLAAPRTIKRPKLFFRENGIMPKELKLEITMPPALEWQMSKAELGALLSANVKTRQRELAAEHKKAKREFLGREGVYAQSPFDCPKGCNPRRGINPKIATKDRWGMAEAKQRLKNFLEAYREAWRAYQNGNLRVEFPPGTYWMVQRLGAAGASLE